MKKSIALICGIFLAVLTIYGQQVPNNSFDNWTNMGDYDVPNDWSSSNEVTATIPVFGVPNVFKDTDAHSGNYSARLQNVSLMGYIIPGGLTLGTIEADILNQTFDVYGGVPYSGDPEAISVWMKSELKDGDSAMVLAIFTKWNGSSQDTVALAMWGSNVSLSEWTNIQVPVIDFLSETPDSVNIAILSSMNLKSPESSILVDDISIVDETGTVDFMKERQFAAFYNRSTHSLNTTFAFSETKNITLSAYDVTGRLLFSEKTNNVKSDKKQYKIPNSFHGLLIVQAICNGERFVEKVMVQ